MECIKEGAADYVLKGHIERLPIAVRAALERKKIEALARANEELLRQRAMAAQLVHRQEEERRRISRDVHDDLSQRLCGLALQLYNLQNKIPAPSGIKTEIQTLCDELTSILEDAQRLAYGLHPASLDDLGLAAALASFVDDFAARATLQVQFTQQHLPDSIPDEVALCVYRVTQEALQNVARHSGAQQAEVKLQGDGACIRIYIWDSGRGFDPGSTNYGLGLTSMRDRNRSDSAFEKWRLGVVCKIVQLKPIPRLPILSLLPLSIPRMTL